MTITQSKPSSLEQILIFRLKSIELINSNTDKEKSYIKFIKEYKTSKNDAVRKFIGEAYYRLGGLFFNDQEIDLSIKFYERAISYDHLKAKDALALIKELKAIELIKDNANKVKSYIKFTKHYKAEYKISKNKVIIMFLGEAYYQLGRLCFKNGKTDHSIKFYNYAKSCGHPKAKGTLGLIEELIVTDTQSQSTQKASEASANPKNIIFTNIMGLNNDNNGYKILPDITNPLEKVTANTKKSFSN